MSLSKALRGKSKNADWQRSIRKVREGEGFEEL
mgnify:CR=1 FL=1